MLTEGNFCQRRFSSCIGCLDCGRSPSNGSANRRSFAFGLWKRSRGCAHTVRASSPHVVDFFFDSGSSGSGHRFFTVDSVDSTVAICPLHFGVAGRMSIFGWARDCWKPRRFLPW